MTDPVVDQDRLDVYRLSIDDVAVSFAEGKSLIGLHRYAGADAVFEKTVEYEYRSAEYVYDGVGEPKPCHGNSLASFRKWTT